MLEVPGALRREEGWKVEEEEGMTRWERPDAPMPAATASRPKKKMFFNVLLSQYKLIQ
jgi:hypothetical protein